MNATKIQIQDLTVEQVGLVDTVEEMLKVLEELKSKTDEPGAPNWHYMKPTEALKLVANAKLVNQLVHGNSISYCISKKGRELYELLYSQMFINCNQ